MDTQQAITALRSGEPVEWPAFSNTLAFAQSLDSDPNLVHLRNEFIIPSKADLKRGRLIDSKTKAADDSGDSIYFCGNSLGLQSKATSRYLADYLQTWNTIAVGAHFAQLGNSALQPFQDMAAECSRMSADLFGALPEEIVVMNTLTVNLHLMMAAFYRPTAKKHKIMVEWRPFPSDWYAVESQIEWHGRVPAESILPVEPEAGGSYLSTEKILSMIDAHAEELALILLPGIQYYSGQLLDIPTITRRARERGVVIGWDLAHAAGNVEVRLHEWGVDFACWCTYKYMNAGAGAIAGVFVHERHGDVVRNRGLKGWYGGDKSVRFLMDNKFVPTPGAQGFQLSNPSAIDLTCLTATLSVFNKTSMSALRSKSLLLTAYAEHLLHQILTRSPDAFAIITPADPRQRGAQLSVLLRDGLLETVSAALESDGIVCDKRKPGIIRVAPAPLYNTFSEIWNFMQTFEQALPSSRREKEYKAPPEVTAQL